MSAYTDAVYSAVRTVRAFQEKIDSFSLGFALAFVDLADEIAQTYGRGLKEVIHDMHLVYVFLFVQEVGRE